MFSELHPHLIVACAVEDSLESFAAQGSARAAVPSLSAQPRAFPRRADIFLAHTKLQLVAHGRTPRQELGVVVQLVDELPHSTTPIQTGTGRLFTLFGWRQGQDACGGRINMI